MYHGGMRPYPSQESQHIFAAGTFADQVAVVTGGGTGIGLATALQLSKLGAKVALCSRSQTNVDAGLAALRESGADERCFGVTCDIREHEQVTAFVSATIEHFGAIDILINNAGGQFPSPAQNITPKGFAAVVRNNLVGTYTMTWEVATRVMIPAKHGRIVNVTANVARGFPIMAHTGAARAGVENLTKSLAVEWAQFNVLINCLAPGVIDSSGMKQYPPLMVKLAATSTPLKRAGTVDETAAAILFLASPASQFITGTTLRMDGGKSLWGDTFPIPDPTSGT